MSTERTETKAEAALQSSAGGAPVAKEAPTEQQKSQPGVPKRFLPGQTVCNEKNEKGKLCSGHLKQLHIGGMEARKHLRGDDVLHQCQTCGALYSGPPLGHVRDPEKQPRFVEKELAAILQAAGGTLPFFDRSKKAEAVPAKPATPAVSAPGTAAPAEETPEQKKARLIAEAKARKAASPAAQSTPEAKPAVQRTTPSASSTSGTDSSAQADAHRPAAEAQAATGQASAAPMSPAAATASPAAGAETPADLAPEASTELTPGAPKNSDE